MLFRSQGALPVLAQRVRVQPPLQGLAHAPDVVDVDGPEVVHVEAGLRRWQRRAGFLLAIAITLGVCWPEQTFVALQRVLLPWSAAKWPTLTVLSVTQPAGGWRIPQGEDFPVVVQIEGVRLEQVEIVHRTPSADYWTTERVTVDTAGKASYTFQAVAEPVDFYVRGGDDRTDRMTLDIIERPRIRKITAYYSYPSYSGLPNRRSESGQLHGLEGTEVKIDGEELLILREDDVLGVVEK